MIDDLCDSILQSNTFVFIAALVFCILITFVQDITICYATGFWLACTSVLFILVFFLFTDCKSLMLLVSVLVVHISAIHINDYNMRHYKEKKKLDQ
jgi:hypothetical protein